MGSSGTCLKCEMELWRNKWGGGGGGGGGQSDLQHVPEAKHRGHWK